MPSRPTLLIDLEIPGPPALIKLGGLLGPEPTADGRLAVPLEHQSAEAVLAACLAAGCRVVRSRIMSGFTP